MTPSLITIDLEPKTKKSNRNLSQHCQQQNCRDFWHFHCQKITSCTDPQIRSRKSKRHFQYLRIHPFFVDISVVSVCPDTGIIFQGLDLIITYYFPTCFNYIQNPDRVLPAKKNKRVVEMQIGLSFWSSRPFFGVELWK